MTFAECVRKRRKELGMTQNDLACRVKVSRQTVIAWERGSVMPDLNNLGALEEALNLQRGTLFLSSQNSANPPQSP